MRKWVLSLILVLSMFLTFSVRAQNPLVLNSLEIDIWPEFDKPGVLIIYHLTLSTATVYPASVAISIPIAGEPNAVAARQVDGSLFNIDATRKVSGQWATLNFTTTTPEVQIEYYDPGLSKDGPARNFVYTWPGDYAVTQLTVRVQQPTGATEMRISPSLGAGAVASDNFTYFTQDIGSVSAGQNFQITIDYQKSNDELSAANLPVQPSAPIDQGGSNGVDLKTWLPWVLGIIGAGLIIGGVIWFWQTGRQQPAVKTARRSRSKAGSYSSIGDTQSSEGAIYCSQCGKRAMPGDQFCRSCGSPIHPR